MATPTEGTKAPDFTAKDQNGNTVSLSDFRGSSNPLSAEGEERVDKRSDVGVSDRRYYRHQKKITILALMVI
jgi:hypothetical protein